MSNEMQLTMTNQHLMPALTMQDAVSRFSQMRDFVRAILRAGVDYGVIPGTTKPTLFKPGAEKLTTFFGLSVRFDVIEKIQDWTGADHGGEPFFYYWYRCGLWRGDCLIAEADGSCNSWESKFRYRQGERKCPTCGKSTIIKGREEWGGGWVCYAKKGGCGAKFRDGDQAIEGQQVGRALNPDPADAVNTIKKQSQKRSLVAATLLAVNASEYFTQDLEDMGYPIIEAIIVESGTGAPTEPPTGSSTEPPSGKQRKAPAPKAEPKATAAPASDNGGDPLQKPFSERDKQERMNQALVNVNEATAGAYNSTAHLYQAMKETAADFAWPHPADKNAWADIEQYLIDRKVAKVAEAAAPF